MTKNSSFNISFSNVYSFRNLSDLKDEMNDGGIYIWGMIFQKQNNQPSGEPYDNSTSFDIANHMFIPYYVGQSRNSLWDCFKQRHSNPLRNNLYLILSYDYIREFYKDCLFPEMIGNGSNRKRGWFEKNRDHFEGRIIYYNNYHILKHLYKFSCNDLSVQEAYSTEYVKNALEKAIKKAEANILENYRNNFFKKMFFCYAKGFNSNELSYEDFESYVFYRLKGKTISKHEKLERVKQKFGSIAVNITSPLSLFKDDINRCFPGYF